MEKVTDQYKYEHKREELMNERAAINRKLRYVNKKIWEKLNINIIVISNIYEIFRVDQSEVLGNRRYKEHSEVRYWYCYILKSLWHTYQKIGDNIWINHAAVMYRVKICQKIMENDNIFKSNLEKCIKNIKKELIW